MLLYQVTSALYGVVSRNQKCSLVLFLYQILDLNFQKGRELSLNLNRLFSFAPNLLQFRSALLFFYNCTFLNNNNQKDTIHIHSNYIYHIHMF